MYNECIWKENGILKKFFPAQEDTTETLRLPEDVHTVASECISIENLPFDDFALENWETAFPVEKIVIPANIERIEENAFSDPDMLLEFVVEEGCKGARAEDGVLFSGDGSVLLRFPPYKAGTYTVPPFVRVIGENAFTNCRRLTAVTLSEGVREIHDDAFWFCYEMETAVLPASVTKIGKRIFDECDKLTLRAPRGSAAERYAEENGIRFEATDRD